MLFIFILSQQVQNGFTPKYSSLDSSSKAGSQVTQFQNLTPSQLFWTLKLNFLIPRDLLLQNQ